MPAIVLVGAQWGDEGKGKVTDLLGSSVDYCVRYQGGNNAGHTVVVDGEKYELHLLPSGSITPGCVTVLANGVVIDPDALLREVEMLESRGVGTDLLRISANAHLLTPYHTTLDKVTERFLGDKKLGTTLRGIGPTYADKVNRVGVRVQDLFDPELLRQRVEGALEQKNQLLVKVYNRRAISVDEITEGLLRYADWFRARTVDTSLLLSNALDDDQVVLFEGAQATLLDMDYGTYPFVTSSNPTAAGAAIGSGISPLRIQRIVGVLKAYITRVGAGPVPTELHDDAGETLRKVGREYGVTTGRPRRCGWLDTVVARYATRINGFTDYFLTKLDVLTGFERVPVCVAYDVDGTRYDEMPMTQSEFARATPVYEYLDGWWEDISHARSFDDLPAAARAYVRRVEELIGVRISGIGVGPGRDQTIQLESLL